MPRPLACVLVAGLVLTACGAEPVAPPEPQPQPPAALAAAVDYACESGGSVAVSYPEETTARLTWRGRSHVLRLQPEARGARYQGEGLEWRITPGDGQETAVLSRLGAGGAVGAAVLERCSRPSPAPLQGEGGDPADPAPPPPCRGESLSLTSEGGDAGAGARVSVFALQNIGSRTCSLSGHAEVALEDSQGRRLTTVRSEAVSGEYFADGQRPAPVELPPQGRAFFDIAWSAVPHEGQGERICPKAERIRVTAPGDKEPVALDQTLQPCGGRIRISPFRAGRDSVAPSGAGRA
jgi:hypothetical protein